MKRFIVNCFALLTVFLAALSCTLEEDAGTDGNPGEIYKKVYFNPVFDCCDLTRSSYVDIESHPEFDYGISEICLLAYDSNGKLGSSYFGPSSGTNLSLRVGMEYDLFALANTGDLSDCLLTREEALSYKCDWKKCMDEKGMPFSCRYDKVQVTFDKMEPVRLNFRRMVSVYDFCLDTESLGASFSVTAVRMKNVARSVSAFTDNKVTAVSDAMDGDYAVKSELQKLNSSSGHITLYVPENMQGNLLEGNSDPAMKSADNVKMAAWKSLCTYIEVVGNYSNKGLNTEGTTFRMYLGTNQTDNFDVIRNRINQIKFSLTAHGVFQDNWKADKGLVTDNRTMCFSPSSLSIRYGEKQEIELIRSDSFEYSIEVDSYFKAYGLEFSQTGDKFVLSSKRKYTEDVTALVTACSWDGRLKAECRVRICPNITTSRELILKGGTVSVHNGLEVNIPQEAQMIKHTFYDGVEQASLKEVKDVTVTSFSVKDPKTASVSGLKVKGLSANSTTYLKGTYDGVSSGWEIKVSVGAAVETGKEKVEGEDVSYSENNSDYRASVSLSSKDAHAGPQHLTVSASADHRYVKTKTTKYKYHFRHIYSDGSVKEDETWISPDPDRKDKTETVTDTRVSDQYSLSSNVSWLNTTGDVSRNETPYERTGTLTLSNLSSANVKASFSVVQMANMLAGVSAKAENSMIERGDKTRILAYASYTNGLSSVPIDEGKYTLSIVYGPERIGLDTSHPYVRGLSTGYGFARATYTYGNRTLSGEATVNVYELSDITLNTTSIDMYKHGLYYLRATAHYTNGVAARDITSDCVWSSSNTTLARFSSPGTVSGQGTVCREVTLTADYKTGYASQSATCKASLYDDYYLDSIEWHESSGTFKVDAVFVGHTSDTQRIARAQYDIDHAYWRVYKNSSMVGEYTDPTSACIAAKNCGAGNVSVICYVNTSVTKYGENHTFVSTRNNY